MIKERKPWIRKVSGIILNLPKKEGRNNNGEWKIRAHGDFKRIKEKVGRGPETAHYNEKAN